jgi:hypothetical protein
MIAGPEFTQDKRRLLDLLLQQPDLVERDLDVVETGVEFGPALRMDAVLRDAIGRPTLLFLLDHGEVSSLPGWLLDAQLWIAENQHLLRRFLGAHGIRWDLAPRFLVLAFEIGSPLLDRLAYLAGIDVDAYELRSLRIGDEVRWAAVPRAGAGLQFSAGVALVKDGAGALPSERTRALQEQLVQGIQGIDPEIVWCGSRYGQEATWRDQRLVHLRASARGLEIRLPALTADESARICWPRARPPGTPRGPSPRRAVAKPGRGSVSDPGRGSLVGPGDSSQHAEAAAPDRDLMVFDERSLARVLDGVLRRYLDLQLLWSADRTVETGPAGAVDHPPAEPVAEPAPSGSIPKHLRPAVGLRTVADLGTVDLGSTGLAHRRRGGAALGGSH